ncbi:hypothetical protein [Streptomyces sp. NPDC018584]|uniref:hypothetical protein n=1 Tax=unclassified Streptomyces TaxID=2593676 RepID=UPI0037A07F41
MTLLNAFLLLAGLYVVTGAAVLAELNVTPDSIRRHHQNVARTDAETAALMRKYPALCAASHVFSYLISLVLWPAVTRIMIKRRKGQRPGHTAARS